MNPRAISMNSAAAGSGVRNIVPFMKAREDATLAGELGVAEAAAEPPMLASSSEGKQLRAKTWTVPLSLETAR